jgi:hypothetical protein
MKKLFLILFSTFNISALYAASCCGGGSSSSAIITGDNQQEITIGYSYRNDIGQTDNDGLSSIHDNSIKDQQYLYTLQFAKILFDRFQTSIKIGVTTKDIDKQKRAEKSSGLQDLELQSSYEFLPEFAYSPIKPRGFSYLKFTAPLSKSLYDSQSQVFSDVRGSGLYSLAPGLFFLKKFTDFSLKSGLEYQYYFGKQYAESRLNDYYKFVIPFGASYSLPQVPIILSATSTLNYQSSKKLEGSIQSQSPSEYFWDLNFSSSYRLTDQASLTLAYSDSSLIGKSINSPLYRIIGLSYNYGWPL